MLYNPNYFSLHWYYEVESWSRFWTRFWILSLVEMLMFGWNFEVDAWSRFWRWNLIKICVWTCDKNSTLGSVVPLAMFNMSMKECLISMLAKHILLIAHAKEQGFCQKHCSKLSYWPPEGGLGLQSCDHVQVRYLESALIEDRSWNWERNKFCEAILTFNTTFYQ